MKAFTDFSEGHTPDFENDYNPVHDSRFVEDKSKLIAELAEKKNTIQKQISKIKELKSLVKKELEIIKGKDEAVPVEEKKITELQEEHSVLQSRFKQLQAEDEEYNQSVLHNSDILNRQREMMSYIDQTSKKQKELNDHIKTLQSSCDLLNNDIETLKINNISHIQAKNQIEEMKNELEAENAKIEQIKMKQKEMAEFLTKTEYQIQEYHNKNLKTELELYDQLKIRDSIKAQRKKLIMNIDEEPDLIFQNVSEAQKKLEAKEMLLKSEREMYLQNENKVRKQEKKLHEQKKIIHRLKRHIQLLDTQIQQEEYLMHVVRQQHEQLLINTNQFSAQIEQSVRHIEKIKREKKMMKKELEYAKDIAGKLQNKLSTVSSVNKDIDDYNFKERENLLMKSKLPDDEMPSPINSLNVHRDYQNNYHDNTARTIEIMRRQSNNLKNNHNQFQNIRFDQKLLNKRIKNCHTGVLNRQYKRDSLFPTSRESQK